MTRECGEMASRSGVRSPEMAVQFRPLPSWRDSSMVECRRKLNGDGDSSSSLATNLRRGSSVVERSSSTAKAALAWCGVFDSSPCRIWRSSSVRTKQVYMWSPVEEQGVYNPQVDGSIPPPLAR